MQIFRGNERTNSAAHHRNKEIGNEHGRGKWNRHQHGLPMGVRLRKKHKLPSYAESKGMKRSEPKSNTELLCRVKELEKEVKAKEKELETCDMRKYLNGEFYNSFSATDRARIIEVTNENHDNPWYGTSGGNPTNDRIFLLSIQEVVKYFGDSGQMKNKNRNPGYDWCKDEYLPWIDDQYNLARRAVDKSGKVIFWTLRSPGAKNYCVASVTGFCGDGFDQGGISVSGEGKFSEEGYFIYPSGCGGLTRLDSDTPINGVRPAMWLRMKG